MCEGVPGIFCRESGEVTGCLLGHYWLVSPGVTDNLLGCYQLSQRDLLFRLGVSACICLSSVSNCFDLALFLYLRLSLLMFETRSHVVRADLKTSGLSEGLGRQLSSQKHMLFAHTQTSFQAHTW